MMKEFCLLFFQKVRIITRNYAWTKIVLVTRNISSNHPQKTNSTHSGLESFRDFCSNKFRSFRAKNIIIISIFNSHNNKNKHLTTNALIIGSACWCNLKGLARQAAFWIFRREGQTLKKTMERGSGKGISGRNQASGYLLLATGLELEMKNIHITIEMFPIR